MHPWWRFNKNENKRYVFGGEKGLENAQTASEPSQNQKSNKALNPKSGVDSSVPKPDFRSGQVGHSGT